MRVVFQKSRKDRLKLNSTLFLLLRYHQSRLATTNFSVLARKVSNKAVVKAFNLVLASFFVAFVGLGVRRWTVLNENLITTAVSFNTILLLLLNCFLHSLVSFLPDHAET
jgi:hypothetical protein